MIAIIVSLLATAPDYRPVDLQKRFWLDVSLRIGTLVETDDGDDSAEIFFLTHHLEGAIPAGTGNVVIAWDLTGLVTNEDDEWGFGNPFLGYTGPVHENVRLTAGVVLPFIDSEDDTSSVTVIAGLLNANLRAPWLWFPDTLSVLVGADVEVPLAEDVRFEGDVRMAASIPTGDGNDETFFVGDLELGLVAWLLHVSVGAVFFEEDSVLGNDDNARFTATLGALVPLPRGRFYANLQIGLDETDILDDSLIPSVLFGYAGHF